MKTRRLSFFLLLLLVLLLTSASAEKLQSTHSREVEFTRAGLVLKGTLEVPAVARGKLPGVVMMHGSGPNDRDESIPDGGVVLKPLKELSHELALRGFAVLRYDKRSYTLVHQSPMDIKAINQLMPQDFIEDARAALEFARTQPEVDPARMIFIGHSQGASFAPWVVKGEELAGAVLIAPGLLTLKDQIEYQTNYQEDFLTKLNQGGQFDAQLAQLRGLREQFRQHYERIDSGELSDDDIAMGASVRFLKEHDRLSGQAPEQIAAMNIPVLLINGTKDLKTPAELLKEKEPTLTAKGDLEVRYQEGMIHEMYRQGTTEFETGVAEAIAEWFRGLEK